MKTGLVSITFRQLSPDQIVQLVQMLNLDGIEWGGDVHVPHGDAARAREVAALTRDAGLQVAAYGSYYRAGHDDVAWKEVLLSAVELGTPLIRVWAGKCGSQEADANYRAQVENDLRRICEEAQRENIRVALEFHGGTLTDTGTSARELLQAVDHPNLKCLWQPSNGRSVETRLQELKMVLPWLSNLHVFQWQVTEQGLKRLPLEDGETEWLEYLLQVRDLPKDRFALLEFVREDAPNQFVQDATTLKSWLDRIA
jgi:sugar phosphate isomerase/epimerase